MIKNIQPITKQVQATTLSIFKIFKTIQGEGPFAGRPAIFIRLAGCNLQCPLCDTDYTTSSPGRTVKEVMSKVTALRERQQPIVVITGGEPFRQDISDLVYALRREGFLIQIETNGTLYWENFPYHLVTLVCSPKTGAINPRLRDHVFALKYVLRAGEVSALDGLPISALNHPAKPQLARLPDMPRDRIYVQPVDEQDIVANARNLEAAINSCQHFGYTLCLQIHKIINLE